MFKMIRLMVIFFGVFAVRCDDLENLLLLDIPEDIQFRASSFKAYWNVPTMQCRSKGIPFPDLATKYGIAQNKDDRFHGERVSILYDPGKFPALLQNGSGWVYRNGGVPQEGNLDIHLELFEKYLVKTVPESFKGVGIIDFESWRPVFRQNFGSLIYYKDVSYEVERKRHPLWPTAWIQDEAVRRFEESGRQFMQATLSLARSLRPRASWGYYGFPYCFNMSPNNRRQQCAKSVPQENQRLSWLWEESTALFPSLYSSRNLSSGELQQLVRGRVQEARRVAQKAVILPYFWYRYRDGGFISEKDLMNTLSTLHQSPASGLMIWGSSNDVNTKAKCLALLDYVETVLGPAVAKFTKPERIENNQLLKIGLVTDAAEETPDNSPVKDGSEEIPENSPSKNGAEETPEHSPVKDGAEEMPENSPVKDVAEVTPENSPVKDGAEETPSTEEVYFYEAIQTP